MQTDTRRRAAWNAACSTDRACAHAAARCARTDTHPPARQHARRRRGARAACTRQHAPARTRAHPRAPTP
eukprot:1230620-Alexandrium_andersonii.AAC.1